MLIEASWHLISWFSSLLPFDINLLYLSGLLFSYASGKRKVLMFEKSWKGVGSADGLKTNELAFAFSQVVPLGLHGRFIRSIFKMKKWS